MSEKKAAGSEAVTPGGTGGLPASVVEEPAAQPLADKPPVPPEPPTRYKVRLAPDCSLPHWKDPQTHLVVTATEQEVPAELVGEATRRETAVVIKEI